MSARRRLTTGLVAAAAIMAGACTPAAAQGLLGFLFGGRATPSVSSYAPTAEPLTSLFGERAVEPTDRVAAGPAVSFCVRTCDGRFFPLQRNAGATPAQLCNSFCPAAKTTVMYGSGIEGARAADGARYADLPNAYVYRQKIADSCTCNGKDPMGLAAIDVRGDPTLRAGDIVATSTGLTTYNGRNSKEAANFTPIDPAKLSADMRKKVSGIEIRDNPARADARPLAAPENVSSTRNTRRATDSAQLSR